MDARGPTLLQRVGTILHAKQYFVFVAVLLYAIDYVVPLVTAWMHRGGSLAEVLRNSWGALANAVAAPSLAIAGVFVVYVAGTTWLRAGYIRSLVGTTHFGPRNTRQYLRLLGLTLILECFSAATIGAVVLTGSETLVVIAVVLVRLAVYFVLMYADYIIIIADVGPLSAIATSWRTVQVAFLPSAMVLLVVNLLGDAASGLVDESVTGSLGQAAPMMIVQCAIMGTVVFVADIVLIAVYLDAAENGRLRS